MPWLCFWSQVDCDKAGFGHTLLSVLSRLLRQMPVAGQWQWHSVAGSSSGLRQQSDMLASSTRCQPPARRRDPRLPRVAGCTPHFHPGRPAVLLLLLVAGYSCPPEWISSSCSSPLNPLMFSHQQSQTGSLVPACLCCFINTTGCW